MIHLNLKNKGGGIWRLNIWRKLRHIILKVKESKKN